MTSKPSLTIDWFKEKKVTVMGLGLHGGGLGTAKWLLRRGALVIVTDMKDRRALASSVAALDKEVAHLRRLGKKPSLKMMFGRHDERDFTSADMVVRNPGVPAEHPLLALAAKKGVAVESDTSLFFLLCPFPISAITGTRGKTTTTMLLFEMARLHDPRAVVAGNVRISVLETLDRILKMSRKEPHPPIVLELSSWQLENLEWLRLSPHVGVLTNIKEDHLNRYRDIEEYARAKEVIVAFQKPDDIAVLNADDVRVAAIGQSRGLPRAGTRGRGSRVLWFSVKSRTGNGCFVVRGKAVLRQDGKTVVLFPTAKIRLKGAHNIPNVLAACAAAAAMGIAPLNIRRAVLAFRGVPGRLEDVAYRAGVTYINDTTATSPDAAIAALKTIGAAVSHRPSAIGRSQAANGQRSSITILLAGGADKGLHYEEMAKEIARRVKHLVLFEGAASDKIVAALSSQGVKRLRGQGGKWVTIVRSMEDALTEARRHAKRGDVILLSPGAASFGLFVNEYDRGDQFVAGVRR